MDNPTGDQAAVSFGIIGPGNIARRFASAVKMVKGASVTAVFGRNEERAEKFCRKYDIPQHFTSLEEFFQSGIDMVYIATPYSFHYPMVKACIRHKKHVLCEKPFTVNARQAEELFSLAGQEGVFVMEAMWTRFLPVMQDVEKWLRDGRIGAVRRLTADFSGLAKFPPEHRLYNPELGGGALLDIGVYCVAFACQILGNSPQSLISSAYLGKTRIDEQSTLLFQYEDGAQAILTSAVCVNGSCEACIYGELGKIVIPNFYGAERAVLYFGDEIAEESHHPYENGFQYEIQAAVRALEEGRCQCREMNWEDTLAVLRLCDRARSQWNLRYPCEEQGQ